MTEEKQQSMLDKVVKLLKKAESTTPEEAEAITAKAQELMVAYAITETMIAHKAGQSIDDHIENRYIDLGKSIYMVAHIELAWRIALANDCKMVQHKTGNRGGVWIVGFTKDIAQVELLLASLLIQQSRALEVFKRDLPAYMSGTEKWKQRRSYAYGYAEGVGDKLRLAARRAEAQVVDTAVAEVPDEDRAAAREVENSGMQLVLVSRRNQVKDWYDENVAHTTRKVRSGFDVRGDGRSKGRQDGRLANTGDPVVGNQKAIGK